jgi:Tfp pilus assembly protein PilV
MRAIAMLLVAAGILFGIYQYHLKSLPTMDSGTVATQAINLTGVRADLLQIAQAERANVALNGKCASLDELTSTSAMAMARTDRGGYTYQVNCSGSGSDFQVVAEHPPAPANAGFRYPKLAIDATMQVREVE